MAKLDEIAARFLWVAHLVIFLGLAAIAWMAADRDPPFRILESEPIHVDRGETAIFDVPVIREKGRRCSAEFARYVFANDGARYDLGTGYASPEIIESMEKRTPGRLVIAVNIPKNIVSGPATMTTELVYVCNKVHALWPIHVSTSIPFVVR